MRSAATEIAIVAAPKKAAENDKFSAFVREIIATSPIRSANIANDI
jgi:hypothetical protein